MVFQLLEVFSSQGISQGQLWFCRIEVFFQFRVVSRLGLARFAYGFVGLMVFQLLEVFSSQGISQGQLWFCRIEVFFQFRVVSRLGLARFAYGFVGLMVFQLLEVFSGQGISQGQLRLCRILVFQGLEWFRAQGWHGFLRLGRVQGFSVVRSILW